MQIALAKQTLKHDFSFSGSDTEVGRSSLERGRKAEERINLSFPGKFSNIYLKMSRKLMKIDLIQVQNGVDLEILLLVMKTWEVMKRLINVVVIMIIAITLLLGKRNLV